MDKTQFEQEKQYGAAFAIAKRLYRCGLTTKAEHHRLTAKLQQRYHVMVGLLPDGSHILYKTGVKNKNDWKGGLTENTRNINTR